MLMYKAWQERPRQASESSDTTWTTTAVGASSENGCRCREQASSDGSSSSSIILGVLQAACSERVDWTVLYDNHDRHAVLPAPQSFLDSVMDVRVGAVSSTIRTHDPGVTV